jgi:hypothetical protein
MLEDYMLMMGLKRYYDYYNRLMYINLSNQKDLPNYCYVMTTVYEPGANNVHWTEGLSYSEHWVIDHLGKVNRLIHGHEQSMLPAVEELPVDNIKDHLRYFFDRKFNTCCVMYLSDNVINDCLRKRRFLYGIVSLDQACISLPRQIVLPPSPQLKTQATEDIYHEIEAMDEGIDQRAIMVDVDYVSVLHVLDDKYRSKIMLRLQTPEKPITLNKDVLVQQFMDNQGLYFSKGEAKDWKDLIIGRTGENK